MGCSLSTDSICYVRQSAKATKLVVNFQGQHLRIFDNLTISSGDKIIFQNRPCIYGETLQICSLLTNYLSPTLDFFILINFNISSCFITERPLVSVSVSEADVSVVSHGCHFEEWLQSRVVCRSDRSETIKQVSPEAFFYRSAVSQFVISNRICMSIRHFD